MKGKRWIPWGLCVLILLLCGVPFQNNDVGRLLPVETVLLRRTPEGGVNVKADGGLWGTGKTVEEAFLDLSHRAQGIVFLQSADFLLTEADSRELLSEVVESGRLRMACGVAVVGQDWDCPLEEAGRYLRIHRPAVALADLRRALITGERVTLPLLAGKEGGLELVRTEN